MIMSSNIFHSVYEHMFKAISLKHNYLVTYGELYLEVIIDIFM